MIRILDDSLLEEINHAIRTCRWRVRVTGDRGTPYVCAGACNICEKLIAEGACETLRELYTAENVKKWADAGRVAIVDDDITIVHDGEGG